MEPKHETGYKEEDDPMGNIRSSYDSKHSPDDSKDVAQDEDYDPDTYETEREWKHALSIRNEARIAGPVSAKADRILEGFRINHMNMRDAVTGRLMWESHDLWDRTMLQTEIEARIPSAILRCRAVAREVDFHSTEEMNDFKLEQRVFFDGVCIEEWFFQFGFVIPGSTNSWQQVIHAEADMMTAEQLSGKVTIETSFLDGKLLLAKNVVRVFYV